MERGAIPEASAGAFLPGIESLAGASCFSEHREHDASKHTSKEKALSLERAIWEQSDLMQPVRCAAESLTNSISVAALKRVEARVPPGFFFVGTAHY